MNDPNRDEVTEAGIESFPTSDPPSWTLGQEDSIRCNHHICTCSVEQAGDSCGPSCRQGIVDPEDEKCFCGHADCSASSGEASNLFEDQ